MIKVGAIDIDTSHPIAFADWMLKSNRGRYTCVYNAGFRSDSYVQKFMSEKNVPVRVSSLEEMAEQVDIAFIHSCNWDKHLGLAEPFIRAGKPVFIDKPIVGSIADCRKVEHQVKFGAVILGSSSFRYCKQFSEFMQKPVSERGEIIALFGSIGVDEFNYGIHVIEALGAFVPAGAESVKCISAGRTEQYAVNYTNGVQAIYQLCLGIWRPTNMVVTTTKGSFSITPDINLLYDGLLGRIFDYMEKGKHMASIHELTESIKIAIAGKVSKEHGGNGITISGLESNLKYDGRAFETYYAKISGV